jgi:hypothetical protein
MGTNVDTAEQLGGSKIQQLLAPLREICSATLEGNMVPRILNIIMSDTLVDWSPAPISVYTMVQDVTNPSMDPLTDAASALPSFTGAAMLQAYSKWNMCDISVFTYLPLIQDLLTPFGAKVEWSIVHPRPRILLHWSWNMNPLHMTNHSVFLITRKEGKEYIADSTMEQFGYYDRWLVDKNEYLLNRTTDGWFRITNELDQNQVNIACTRIQSFRHTAERLRDAYLQFDWSVLDGAPTD